MTDNFDRLEFREDEERETNMLRSAVLLILCMVLAGALVWSYL